MPKKIAKKSVGTFSGLGDSAGFSKSSGSSPLGLSISSNSSMMTKSANKIARDKKWIEDAIAVLKRSIGDAKDRENKELLREIEEEEQLLHWKLVKIDSLFQNAVAETQLMLFDMDDLKGALGEIIKDMK
jgi:hypothetical protein